MYRNLIDIYVSNLTYDDLVNYIDSNYVGVPVYDKEIIYKFIKSRYKELFSNKDCFFNELKDQVTSNTYLEVIKLYDKYKKYLTK